ncbi:hypothetical protein ES703_11157 [subsurface metagenome]
MIVRMIPRLPGLLRMMPRLSAGTWRFWGIMVFIGVNILWVGVLEKFAPIWVGIIIGAVIMIAIMKYGPQPMEEEE